MKDFEISSIAVPRVFTNEVMTILANLSHDLATQDSWDEEETTLRSKTMTLLTTGLSYKMTVVILVKRLAKATGVPEELVYETNVFQVSNTRQFLEQKTWDDFVEIIKSIEEEKDDSATD